MLCDMSLAHRIKITLGPDRRLELTLPEGFPTEGEAEVIVLADVRSRSYELPDRSAGVSGATNPLEGATWAAVRESIYGAGYGAD